MIGSRNLSSKSWDRGGSGGAMVDEGQLHNRNCNEYTSIVHSSDHQLAMAQRLEQLETVLTAAAAQEASIAHSSSDGSMALNSSDLSGWIEGMIEELTAANNVPTQRSSPFTADSPYNNNTVEGSSTSLDSFLDTTHLLKYHHYITKKLSWIMVQQYWPALCNNFIPCIL
jgi:hypothetical protein